MRVAVLTQSYKCLNCWYVMNGETLLHRATTLKHGIPTPAVKKICVERRVVKSGPWNLLVNTRIDCNLRVQTLEVTLIIIIIIIIDFVITYKGD